MSTLYELTEQYQKLLELADDPDIELDVFQDTLDGLTGEIENKANGYGAVIRELEADTDALDAEIRRLTTRKAKKKEVISRMKESLKRAMEMTDKPRIQTALFTFSIKRNPPSVVMETDDWRRVPEEFLKTSDPTIDKAKVKEALKNGELFPGVAHLEQTDRLDIR